MSFSRNTPFSKYLDSTESGETSKYDDTTSESDNGSITTAALGRPFHVGIFYDRVRDMVMPGETILTMKDIENHTTKMMKPGTSCKVIYGDSSEDKSKVFSGDANLELNVLTGVVTLGSSGKFLTNKVSTKKQLQVWLTAEYTMFFKVLEMNHFVTAIKDLKTKATHIVTAIEYGTNVTFTFDRTVSDNEDLQEVKGQLKQMIDCLPVVQTSGNAEINKKDIETNKSEKVSCKFYGDIILPVNPTTYEEAVRVFRELPSLLKEDNAVPVKVWLYPIPKGVTPENKVLQIINMEKKRKVVAALDDLQRIYVSTNDLMSSQAFVHIPEVQRKIGQFRRTVQTVEDEFQDKVLGELLKECNPKKYRMSQLMNTIDEMKHWVSQNTEIEINLLNTYINKIKKAGIEILDISGIDAKLFEHDDVIILDIMLPYSAGQYEKKDPGASSRAELQPKQTAVKQRIAEIDMPRRQDTTTTPPSTNAEIKSWYISAKIKAGVRKKIKRFIELKSNNSCLVFFVTLTDCKDTELHDDISCIRAVRYKDGEEHEEINLFTTEADEIL